MIRTIGNEKTYFILETQRTTYAFRVMSSGHLEHIYYGAKITAKDSAELDALAEKREFELGNVIAYSKEHPLELPEDVCYEVSGAGHGDIREPSVAAAFPDGSTSVDFVFDSFVIDSEKPDSDALPGSYSESGEYEHLMITLKDGDLTLLLHYCVYPECDVITRSCELINNGPEDVTADRLMSFQLDIPESGLCVSSFHGAWVREMERSCVTLDAGKFVIESRAGCSSSRANPFFMVHGKDADETSGVCMGFNLIYSGDHYSAIEVNAFGKTRIVGGMNPGTMRFQLESGERLISPEAVITYSCEGFSRMSANMHDFVTEHIIRGKYKNAPRPILLNSWEACYFNISEQSLLSLAKAGKALGAELFVMDDGWFGERNDDSHSLGDWDASKKKLPSGVSGLAKKITSSGMRFGIWVEPEMVNTESELYKAHPEWAMEIPGKLHSEGRNQRILDLSNGDVVRYITDKMTEVFSCGDITYVKWDMNRIFSDAFSQTLEPKRMGEVRHRYICGLYNIMKTLTEKFPDILFEGCASGGNRFDLGILCFFPQIWASDNTDALCRARIQEGCSYAYPQCCIGAHAAASPNHQTLRETPLETRMNIAAFGALGYELDVRDLSSEQKQQIIKFNEMYKQWRDVFLYGRFYRISTGNLHSWCCVSKDKKRAVGIIMQELVRPNTQLHRFVARGLDPDLQYRFSSESKRVNVKQFGSLINTLSPFHVKQDSLVHNVIAKAVKMNGEAEDCVLSGSALMNAGIALKPAFSGTGFNENVRVFPDFASRLYFMEALEEK